MSKAYVIKLTMKLETKLMGVPLFTPDDYVFIIDADTEEKAIEKLKEQIDLNDFYILSIEEEV